MPDTPEPIKDQTDIEYIVMSLILRLNKSLAELDALNKFPQANKPHTTQLYRDVYQDMYELVRISKIALSKTLLIKLNVWRTQNFTIGQSFTQDAIILSEEIYNELSQTGMVNIKVQKTSGFPIDFYLDRLP